MYRTHQRLGRESRSAPNEECFEGCGGSRYSSQVWHASFQVLGGEIERDTTARFLLCNDFGVWTNEEIILGKKVKYMITIKEKPINHPINYVHIDLETFVLYSDSLNHIDSQLVEANDISEILKIS